MSEERPVVYSVVRSCGEYSDRYETTAAVFSRENDARWFVTVASAQAREAEKRFPVDYTTYDDEAALEGRRSVMRLDPEGVDAYDTPTYYLRPAPFYASADDARHQCDRDATRSAETAPTGSGPSGLASPAIANPKSE